ncbi:DUF4340 domain-containing protein [Luteolibacter yonseiensis]|uniref:DUF4340 domain-containing protein n=1 Tax=Luteolibacter yonseiensis TaxID=1144680 RepID=A0A934R865_9BACT|nr:DUF4340 domain-containing protein [Luteolibacter yonseiensis]MBK1817708.1 DUF4340 domain-containing protein [Luteolibacter yonseiensis]
MNKRQVIILWGIALALGVAVAAVKFSQNESTRSATKRTAGQTLFESFPAAETATIDIQGSDGTVTLTKKDGKWVVAQRDNFPANTTYVNDFIRTLNDLKVTQGMEAGPSLAPRFGMDESATVAAERGLTAGFKDAAGKEIAKVALGKNIGADSESDMMDMEMGSGAVGRYVRNYADESGFYAVGEMFPSVSDEVKRWLADGFINPEKIKSITMSLPDKTDPDWKLVRDNEEAEFKLDAAAATEVLDSTAATALRSVLSYARFDDVVPAAKVAERAAAGKLTATLETFEGFIYNITLTPTKASAAPSEPAVPGAEPPATDNYLMTVAVNAELPKERKKEEGEKPEDAKTKDTAFTERQKVLTEKLAKEKAFAGITFEVAKSTVEPLLKDRKTLTTKPDPALSPDDSQGSVQQLPGGLIARPPGVGSRPPVSATTPPISIPTVYEDENGNEINPGEEGAADGESSGEEGE